MSLTRYNSYIFYVYVSWNDAVHSVKFGRFCISKNKYKVYITINLKFAPIWFMQSPEMVLIIKYSRDIPPGTLWWVS